jgi:hypothetical protein
VNIKELREKLNLMVNDHYNTPEILRFFSFPMILPKPKILFIHTLHSNMNRRNCWGFVQGTCPPETLKAEELPHVGS